MSGSESTDSRDQKQNEKFTSDSWRMLLEQAISKAPSGAISMMDISETLGVGLKRAREIVRAGIEDGLVEYAGRKAKQAIDGRSLTNCTPLYRMVRQGKKK